MPEIPLRLLILSATLLPTRGLLRDHLFRVKEKESPLRYLSAGRSGNRWKIKFKKREACTRRLHVLWVSLNGDVQLVTILANAQCTLNSLSALGNPWPSISSPNTAMLYNTIDLRIPV